MPRRSNNFQKLVYYITSQLAAYNDVVSESEMLADSHSGELREVDIFISDPNDIYGRKVSIEATSKSRKLDRPAIEKLKAKHEYLDSGQLIIVSKSGFAKTCFRYAKLHSIQLLTFEEATSAVWPEWLDVLKKFDLNHYRFQSLGGEIYLEKHLERDILISEKMQVESGEYGTIPVQQYIEKRFLDTERQNIIGTRNGVKEWTFDPPMTVIDETGLKGQCVEIKMKYSEKVEALDLNMKYREFLGKSVAYGVSEPSAGFKKIALTASKAGENESGIGITLHIQTADT